MTPDDATIVRAVRDLADAIHAELDTAAEPDHSPRNVARALADYFPYAEYRSSTADAAVHRFTAIVAMLHGGRTRGVIVGQCPECGVRIDEEGWPVAHQTDEGEECPYDWTDDPLQQTETEEAR